MLIFEVSTAAKLFKRWFKRRNKKPVWTIRKRKTYKYMLFRWLFMESNGIYLTELYNHMIYQFHRLSQVAQYQFFKIGWRYTIECYHRPKSWIISGLRFSIFRPVHGRPAAKFNQVRQKCPMIKLVGQQRARFA